MGGMFLWVGRDLILGRRWHECFSDPDVIYPSGDLEVAKWVSRRKF